MSSVQANWAQVEVSSIRPRALNRIFPYIFLGLLAALYLFPFVRVLTWAPDEGVAEYGAQMVLHGGMPARDFIELYAPGSYYWLALIFKLFGTTVIAARGLLLFEGVATALLVTYLSRRIRGVGLFAMVFVLTTSIPMDVINSPHYDANFFALLSFAIFLSAEHRIRPDGRNGGLSYWLMLLAGLLAGWTSCLLQEKGFYLALAFLISLAILHKRESLRFAAIVLAGFLLPIAAGLSFYAAAGALPDLIYANFALPLSVYRGINAAPYGYPLWEKTLPVWFSMLHRILPLPLTIVFVGALSVPFLLILILPMATPVLGYLERSTAFGREWLPYWLVACALAVSELHRLDLGHARHGCVMLVVLFFALCEIQKKKFLRQAAVAVMACVILSGAVDMLAVLGCRIPIQTRRGTLLARESDSALEFLLHHTRAGDEVLVYPYRPVYYFLADLRNPTRLSCFMYGNGTEPLFREAVRDIDRQKVRYVLWDTVFSGENLRSIFPSYRVPPPNQLIMEPYLESHYRQVGFENGFRILERIQ